MALTGTINFDRELREFEGDVRDALREIATEEIAAQVRLGNDTFRTKVDGREGKPIGLANRRVQVDFATFAIEEAVRDIERRVARLTPKRTGRLRKAWRWELNGRPVNPFAITRFRTRDVLRYVNLEPYIRKAVTRYGARSVTRRRRGRRRRSGTRAPDRVVRTSENLTKRVVRLTRRKYRGLIITDPWVQHPGWPRPKVARDTRIPSIQIRLSKRLVQV